MPLPGQLLPRIEQYQAQHWPVFRVFAGPAGAVLFESFLALGMSDADEVKRHRDRFDLPGPGVVRAGTDSFLIW